MERYPEMRGMNGISRKYAKGAIVNMFKVRANMNIRNKLYKRL